MRQRLLILETWCGLGTVRLKHNAISPSYWLFQDNERDSGILRKSKYSLGLGSLVIWATHTDQTVKSRNKEGKSLSRIPVMSSVSDICIKVAHCSAVQYRNINLFLCRTVRFCYIPRTKWSYFSSLPKFPLVLRFRLTLKQLLLLRNPPPLRPSECCIWILATTTKICCLDKSTFCQQNASTLSRYPSYSLTPR